MSPAGRLHVSLADWATIQRVFIAEGAFLSAASIDRLLTPAQGRGYRQALGWAPARGFDAASFAQQGSNTFWVATALMSRVRTCTAMIICNEGRARILRRTPRLAESLLRTLSNGETKECTTGEETWPRP